MKMKTLIKQIAFITGLAFLISCSDSEKVTNILQDATERGTVLKTIDSNLEFEVAEDNLVTVSAEVIDQRGQDFEKIDVYLSFKDNRDVDDETDADNFATKEEMLFETFTVGDLDMSGEYPVLNFDFTTDEFDSFFGFNESDYIRGGNINIRMELVMNNGTVFTSTNVNSVVSGGAFYDSPFQYGIYMICQPEQPDPGTWEVTLQDSEGDGWNGAELLVTIDGVETSYSLASGLDEEIQTFAVPSGTDVLSLVFSSGDNDGDSDGEISFLVQAPNGNFVINAGPGPDADTELIDYCKLDYRP